MYFALSLLTVVYSAVMVVNGRNAAGAGYLICFALLLALYRWNLNKAVRMNLRRMFDTGASKFTYTTSFEDDFVKMVNHTTGAEIMVKYRDIVRVVESKSVILVFARGGQFLMSFKNQLSTQQQKELKLFLLDPGRLAK